MPALVQLHQWGPRSIATPPQLQSKLQMNPTLIVSWWCTLYSLVIILVRVLGRWVRTERLFREDKVMMWSIIPLLARMAFVHVILIWGTNNTQTDGLTQADIENRSIGSRLVLVSRILYATYIWVAKITVLEFVQRIIGNSWTMFYEKGVRIIYIFLGLTYAGVVISTLAECQPFPHYWQVVPDPGYACRSGAAQLLTMGICDIITDVVLMAFPIPLVVLSKMPLKKKVSLCLLFLLSLILIAVTAYRIPATIERHFSQQFRSLLASLEILAATSVANSIAIGSFLRDKGVKKVKFRANSQDESVSDNTITRTRSKVASIAQHHWGSDDDLVRDLGLTVRPELRHMSVSTSASRPAPPAEASTDVEPQMLEPIIAPQGRGLLDPSWTFRRGSRVPPNQRRTSDASTTSSSSTDFKLQVLQPSKEIEDEPLSPMSASGGNNKKLGFFDVGGLMDNPPSENSSLQPASRRMSQQHASSMPRSQANFLSDIGGLMGGLHGEDSHTQAALSPAEDRAQLFHQNRGRSRSPFTKPSKTRRNAPDQPLQNSSAKPIPKDVASPDALDISDAGGLLG